MSGQVNRHRGETGAIVDGEPRRLCLTLGGLADLETHFGVSDLPALLKRLTSGPLSSADIAAILAVGLCGGGMKTTPEAVLSMRFDGGPQGAVETASLLLAATFGSRSAQ